MAMHVRFYPHCQTLCFKVLKYPYSPDLAPSNFHFDAQAAVQGRRFTSNQEDSGAFVSRSSVFFFFFFMRECESLLADKQSVLKKQGD